MAPKGVVFVMGIMILCVLVATANGRKVLMNSDRTAVNVPSGEESLYLTALPKGKVPASTPSKRGHAATIDQKLIARHLSALDRHRNLRSVPSPGVGH